ncbi:MAG: YihA family ribosome biogenesis GTP-binding protein [Alphaproteobacteria bacterium]|nr:YihA family ribosome biogenesis GTP-binding protein [Alphaproteobacteria bacterium]
MNAASPPIPGPAELERGRRLFAAESRFVAAADRREALPPERLPEVALFGRSNVGKSSLLNALTGRKNLAHVSRTPGRTRALNFFSIGDRLMLVDLPGYGFAAVSHGEARRWGQTVGFYLERRTELKRALLLVDARHGLKDSDRLALDLLAHHAVSVMAVLTKADKLAAPERAGRMAAMAEALARHPSAFPAVIAISAETGLGIPELRATLAALAS